jgi:hypothetical protein
MMDTVTQEGRGRGVSKYIKMCHEFLHELSSEEVGGIGKVGQALSPLESPLTFQTGVWNSVGLS